MCWTLSQSGSYWQFPEVGVEHLGPLGKHSSLLGALMIIVEDLEKKINLTVC